MTPTIRIGRAGTIEPAQEPNAALLAHTAEQAIRALRSLGAAELAGNPGQAYTVLDHLSMVIGHTLSAAAMLADQLRQWAELCADAGRPDQAQRLSQAARLTGLHVVGDAGRLFERTNAVLSTLDRRRYRTDRDIPLDLGEPR